MNWLFSPPSLDDLIRVLKAWRFWVLGALTGALLGAALFYIAPPPYRARATVNVDFNLEEAWPKKLIASSSTISNVKRASWKRSPGRMT